MILVGVFLLYVCLSVSLMFLFGVLFVSYVPNIPMKFTGYMAWILLCKHCKFGEKICYNSGDIEFFLGDYFFGAPCTFIMSVELVTIGGQHWWASAPLAACQIVIIVLYYLYSGYKLCVCVCVCVTIFAQFNKRTPKIEPVTTASQLLRIIQKFNCSSINNVNVFVNKHTKQWVICGAIVNSLLIISSFRIWSWLRLSRMISIKLWEKCVAFSQVSRFKLSE